MKPKKSKREKRERCPHCEGHLVRHPFDVNTLVCDLNCGYSTEAYYGPTESESLYAELTFISESIGESYRELFL